MNDHPSARDIPASAATLDFVRDSDGRDEMNLAEYPIGLLADRAPDGVKTITYHDRDETLTITGSDLLGLPTALDVDVIIALLYLTKQESRFGDMTVHFTRYQLLRLLEWPDRGYYYERLTESLNRWVGVTLIYKKSWWDNETKTKGNHSFHILDSATVIEQEQMRGARSKQSELPLSSVRWSSEFFKSFQANNLKKLDLNAYFTLKSAISKQLYRFLDKRFYNKAECTFDLRALACEHVGLSRNYELWRLKQKLQPAIDELTGAGFLKPLPADRRFKKTGRGQWTVTFVRGGAAPSLSAAASASASPPEAAEEAPSGLEAELVAHGVSAGTARELVRSFPEERISAQIEQTLWLKKSGRRKITDLGAFLTKAVRDDYARPAGFVSAAEKAEQQRAASERRKLEAAEARRRRDLDKRAAEEKRRIADYWDGLSAPEKEVMKAEALASCDPEIARDYLEQKRKRSPVAETFFRFGVREPFIRRKLGLPPERTAE
jgi:hypothetical protein